MEKFEDVFPSKDRLYLNPVFTELVAKIGSVSLQAHETNSMQTLIVDNKKNSLVIDFTSEDIILITLLKGIINKEDLIGDNVVEVLRERILDAGVFRLSECISIAFTFMLQGTVIFDSYKKLISDWTKELYNSSNLN